jgi:hypothetical protein
MQRALGAHLDRLYVSRPQRIRSRSLVYRDPVSPQPTAGRWRRSPSTQRNAFQKLEEVTNGGNAETEAQSNRSGGPSWHVRRHGRGERVESLEMNDTIEIPVEPGRHTLHVRNGRNSSRTRTFDAAGGELVAFRCTGKRFLPLFLASFVIPSLALVLIRE